MRIEASCCSCNPFDDGVFESYDRRMFGDDLFVCVKCGTVQRFVPARMERVMGGSTIRHVQEMHLARVGL